MVPGLVFVVWWLAHSVVAHAAGQSIAGAMLNADGAYYLDIARHGYTLLDPTYTAQQNTAFFPGLPWFSIPFLVFGDSAAVIVVSAILGSLAFLGVHRAAAELFGTRVAHSTVITLACWPGSVWLWAFYSESLLIAASSWALWADRRRYWPLAAGLIYVTALSRSVGILFGLTLAVAHVWRTRRVDRAVIAYSAASIAGLATVYVTQRIQVSDGLAFQHSEHAWGRGLSWPWVPMADGLSQIAGKLPGIAIEALINAAAVVLFLGSGLAWTVWAARKPRERAVELGLWTMVAASAPQLTTAFGSMLRFVTAGWTWFVQCAWVLDRLPRWARVAVWVALAACSVYFTHRFVTGGWVG